MEDFTAKCFQENSKEPYNKLAGNTHKKREDMRQLSQLQHTLMQRGIENTFLSLVWEVGKGGEGFSAHVIMQEVIFFSQERLNKLCLHSYNLQV